MVITIIIKAIMERLDLKKNIKHSIRISCIKQNIQISIVMTHFFTYLLGILTFFNLNLWLKSDQNFFNKRSPGSFK